MMPEENKEVVDPTTTPKEVKEEKPTLESLQKQNQEINEKLEKVLKQNADKDSHISKIQNENKSLRETVQKISTSITGKSEKQKDAILERHRDKFLEQGYDEKSVDLILETINDVAEKKAQEKIVPVIMDVAQDLVESDAEIDKKFLENNSEEITEEYNSYKLEVSPRKIKANLKKAYNAVKERLAEKAKAGLKDKEKKDREEMLPGGSPPEKGGKKDPEDNFIEGIRTAGTGHSHFI